MTRSADLAALINTGTIPAGSIVYYPSSTTPTGFLRCNGSIYNRSAYPNLASVIGTPTLLSAETLRNSILQRGRSLTLGAT